MHSGGTATDSHLTLRLPISWSSTLVRAISCLKRLSQPSLWSFAPLLCLARGPRCLSKAKFCILGALLSKDHALEDRSRSLPVVLLASRLRRQGDDANCTSWAISDARLAATWLREARLLASCPSRTTTTVPTCLKPATRALTMAKNAPWLRQLWRREAYLGLVAESPQ